MALLCCMMGRCERYSPMEMISSQIFSRSTIRMILENVSGLPIDFVRLAFDDSTIGSAQQALADGDLSVFDTYETEYDLLHRRVFSWFNESETGKVDPG